MRFSDLLRAANRNLFRNKLRTLLTVAAIFVGSFTLTMTNGVGDGMRAYVEKQVKSIESDTVVFIHKKIQQPDGQPKGGAPREYKEDATQPGSGSPEALDPAAATATLSQVKNILKDLPVVKSVTPQYMINGEYITLDGQKKYEVQLGMQENHVVFGAEGKGPSLYLKDPDGNVVELKGPAESA